MFDHRPDHEFDPNRSVDRWIVWERMGREKRWTVRDDGRGAEGEGNAHQRGIELRIPCEDHRGIRSHGDSSDSFIRGTCESPVFARVHFVYFDGRGPPVSQDAKAAKLFRLFTFDGRWCIKRVWTRESRTMILIPRPWNIVFPFGIVIGLFPVSIDSYTNRRHDCSCNLKSYQIEMFVNIIFLFVIWYIGRNWKKKEETQTAIIIRL